MDDDGVDAGRRIPIRVKVVVAGDEMTIDLTEVSAQVKGFYNSGETAGRSAAQVAFKCLTAGLELPVNDGAFRNLTIVLPSGTVVSAERPAPMRWWMTLLHDHRGYDFQGAGTGDADAGDCGAPCRSGDCLDQWPAAARTSALSLSWRADRRRLGRQARRRRHRRDCLINDGDTHNGPSEQVEAKFPLIVERYALREFRRGWQISGRHGDRASGAGATPGHVQCPDRTGRLPATGSFRGLSALGNEVRLERGGEVEHSPTGKGAEPEDRGG